MEEWKAGSRLQVLGVSVFLAGLILIAYGSSWGAGWHLDDYSNILENPSIRITDLRPATLLSAMIQDRRQNRPFSNLTFALNYYFQKDQVWSYHLVNWFWHWLASLAAYVSLRLIFRRSGFPAPQRDGAALAAVAVWAVHPIHTQAVTYVVQRQSLMASALMLIAFTAYLQARETIEPRPKLLLFGLAILAWLMALGSKEIAFVTPALILLYEFFFFQNFSPVFLRRHRLGLLAAPLVFLAILAVFLRPEMWNRITQSYADYPFTLGQRLLTEPRVLLQYLGLILWPLPSHLTLEHDPAVSFSLLHPWTTGPAVLLWLALLALAVRYARRFPLFSFAGFWYLGNLFLESSFLPLDLMNEHRLYLASLAVVAPLISAPILALPRCRWALASVGLIILMLAFTTVARNQAWQTEPGLWRDCIRKAPGKARPYISLGNYFLENTQADRAISVFTKALALDPQSRKAYYNRGLAYARKGEETLAIGDYTRALQLDPNFAKAFNNRGTSYWKQGQANLALSDYSRALALNPVYADAYFNRGSIYLKLGKWDRAVLDLTKALELNPEDAEAYAQRGNAYLQKGYPDRAKSDFSQARSFSAKAPNRD